MAGPASPAAGFSISMTKHSALHGGKTRSLEIAVAQPAYASPTVHYIEAETLRALLLEF